jgi:hypothetical protein
MEPFRKTNLFDGNVQTWNERERLLFKALDSDDCGIRTRALQELRIECTNKNAKIKAAFKTLEMDNVGDDLYDGILNLRDVAIDSQDMIQTLLSTKNYSEFKLETICISLALLKDNGIAFNSCLQKFHDAQPEASELRMASSIALANIDGSNSNAIREIAHHFRTGDLKIQDKIADLILLSRSEAWLNDDIIETLGIILKDKTNSLSFVYLAGQTGIRGKTLLGPLKKAMANLTQAKKTNLPMQYVQIDPVVALVYEFVLRKIRGNTNPDELRTLVKKLGYRLMPMFRDNMGVHYAIANFLLDEHEIRQIIGFLNDSDNEVVAGAAKICGSLGYRCKEAGDILTKRIHTEHNQWLFIIFVHALATFGDEKAAVEIENAYNKQAWDISPDMIDRAINMIRMK